MGLDSRFNMEELLVNGTTLGINFFLSDKGLGWKSQLVVVFDIDYQENRVLNVFSEHFIDLNIMAFE